MGIYWLILIAFLFVYIQGKIYKKWGLKHLHYTRYFNQSHCMEGDEVQLVERVANRKWLPLPWLRLEVATHASLKFAHQADMEVKSGKMYQNHKSFFSLLPYTQITRRHKVTCLKRGCFKLNTASMTCGDSVGLNSIAKTFDLDIQILVYPRPLPMDEIDLPSHSWQGDITVRRWIVDDPFVISGVREYRYGDPLNGINWKATARSGKLQVHNRDFTADHRLMIYLNFEVDEKMWKEVKDPELIEQGIRYAAAVTQYAISHGIETGFGCNGHLLNASDEQSVRVDPYNGESQLTEIFQTMAQLVVDVRTVSFDAYLERDVQEGIRNTDFLLVTSFVSHKMETVIRQLEQNGNAVKIVNLSHGNVHFQANEGGEAV